ncbi:MAG: tRNA (adenosine(37)-N6)-threonylcarbamoyltransferase complex transferase subunit TsaD [Bdellovibrionaceae bacterium]|nr:tRNA (adenosine(37)-N6)-threonylcarbamoyltransferase complex transferase subunit TsaD [Pseudobdellovibrionaceae bacterium]NUM59522.1 tRNA (adenosine(37)-N6)-threonylcarbamoyltransferase complex transferase subunit TsaD [Pseudobdellovibrionaceae bacterium]
MPNIKNSKIELILAIETSCDDTSVALVNSEGYVVNMLSANQDLAHSPYGGIVPEIASRNHTFNLIPLIDELLTKSQLELKQIQGIAVTNRPGLIGALIVGLTTAKSLSQALGIPLIGVNHLEGHLLAPFVRDAQYTPPSDFSFPFIALAISGGHTSLYLAHDFSKYQIIGRTKDDAAGEAFDKFAKMLGFEFPGGVKIDKLSKGGNPTTFDFPRSMIFDESLDMSFSGLKSAGHRFVEKNSKNFIEENISDICASFQEAIVDVLIAKLDLACKKFKIKRVVVTGGVSANSRLREKVEQWSYRKKIQFAIPPLRYCTDNAAMIGYVGVNRLNRGEKSEMNLGPSPDFLTSDFYQPEIGTEKK